MTDQMSALKQAATASAPDDAASAGTVIVAGAEAGLPALWAYFGSGDDRQVAEVFVGDERIGFVARGAAMAGMADQVRSLALGDASAGAAVPGQPTGTVDIELRCDEPGCPKNPFHTILFDEDYPPHCPLHPARELQRVKGA
jgi:hypothetical protein